MSEGTVFSPTDMRRAAALMTHYGAGDGHGVLAIFAEADDARAMADLAGAVVTLAFELAPELGTADGLDRLRGRTQLWATVESQLGSGQ